MTVESMTSFTLLSTLFRDLADPARLSYLLAVREQPRTVNAVVVATGLSQPNVSKHLVCLRECVLVQAKRVGRSVSYQLANSGVETLLQAAERLLTGVGEYVTACPNYGEEHQA